MKSIHPFPAKMAPDLVKEKLISFPTGLRILDPMCGSGTTLRYASDMGHKAVGWDIDPLAVKVSRTWCSRYDLKKLRKQADLLETKLKSKRTPFKSRFSDCPETQEFCSYWFAKEQRSDLNNLSILIEKLFPEGRRRDFFQVAMSRVIITKFKGASLAWDVSHSRPHKKRVANDFETIPEFFSSVEKLIQIFESYPSRRNVSVKRQDCRKGTASEKFDLIITSPPYLNAIDYMRGHKFSLIWMGHTIPELREIRSNSVGTERGMPELLNQETYTDLVTDVCKGQFSNPKVKNFILRYVYDCETIMKRMSLLLRPKGQLFIVIGNSMQSGTRILNDKIFSILASKDSFNLTSRQERYLPTKLRYLPVGGSNGQLAKRMKKEIVLQFSKA